MITAKRCVLLLVFWGVVGGMASGALPPIERVEVPTPAYGRNLEVEAEVRRLLEAEDTRGLEGLAEELRSTRERLDGGTWILSTFYRRVSQLPRDSEEASARMAFLERWAEENPESITAQVSYAMGLASFAWQARGSGWASTVTEDGWALFRERLEEAAKVLTRAAELEAKCPGWFSATQTVALGQGWEYEDYMAMVDLALEREPTYGAYYTSACQWLLPRWHGRKGEYVKWLTSRADRYPEEERDRQYARLVWLADRMPADGEVVFSPGMLDWPRTVRGFSQWLEEEPENLGVRLQFLRLALLANDAEEAARQFDVVGGRYFPPMWKNEEQFEAARAFAYEDGPNPLKKPPQRQQEVPDFSLSPEVIRIVELAVRVLVGFGGGLLAGVCLLILAVQCGQKWAGLSALLLAILSGTIFGTLATVVPAVALWLYLRRCKPRELPDSERSPSAWMTALGVFTSGSLFLGFQIVAITFVIGVEGLKPGGLDEAEFLQKFMADGTVFAMVTEAGWVAFLGLLCFCGPRSAEDFRARLGLNAVQWVPAVLWTLLAAGVIYGVGVVIDPYLDEKSRAALEEMALGIQSPLWYFLALTVVAPVFEELLFRGYAFSGWREKLGVVGTTLLTALIFTVCHIQYGLVALAFVFILGFVLGVLRWVTGSVYPCILVHFANNLGHAIEVALRANSSA